MRVYLPVSWVLTDEHPMATKGIPALIDMETRRIYHPGDRIMGISAQQVVSLAVETRRENYVPPEEMHFISRFTIEDPGSQSVHDSRMGNVKKLSCNEIEVFRKGHIESLWRSYLTRARPLEGRR
jgi:hypothetical protein